MPLWPGPDSIITWDNLKSGLRFVTRLSSWGPGLMTAFLGILTASPAPVLESNGGRSAGQPRSLNQIRNDIFNCWPEAFQDTRKIAIYMKAWVVIIPDFFFHRPLWQARATCDVWGALGDNLDSPNMTSKDHSSVLREAHPKTHKF